MSDIITVARALLAAATPGPWHMRSGITVTVGAVGAVGAIGKVHDMRPCGGPCFLIAKMPKSLADDHANAALIAAAPELIEALCDDVESAWRLNTNQVGLINAWAGKCERVEAERDALRAEKSRHMRELDASRECFRAAMGAMTALYENAAAAMGAGALPDAEHLGPEIGVEAEQLARAIAAIASERDALRADVERLRAEFASVMGECARLRSDVDVEREQSAAFVKEIERLRVVEAGAAIMRRVLNEVALHSEWASTVREALRNGAGKDFLFQLLSAESDLAHTRKELAFDRKYAEQALDAAYAEKERLRAEIEKERSEVERLRARKAEVCDCVHATGMIGESFVDVDDDCPNCGGFGAVIVEGEK